MTGIGITAGALERIQAHEQVIEITLRIADDELAQAIVDLSRTARRELLRIGLTPSYVEAEVSSYEMLLTQHLMPEVASRLSRGGQAPLMLSREEMGDGSPSRLSDADLRRITGACWSRTDFSRIGTIVRARFDPDGMQSGRVFATEVIGQEPCNGNIVEIALSRAAPPAGPEPTPETDWFADRILRTGRFRGLESPTLVWTPQMRIAPAPPITMSEPEPV
jgi:hypothetical protein